MLHLLSSEIMGSGCQGDELFMSLLLSNETMGTGCQGDMLFLLHLLTT